MVLNLDKLWFQSICNLLSLNYVVGRIMVLATKSLAYTARLFRFRRLFLFISLYSIIWRSSSCHFHLGYFHDFKKPTKTASCFGSKEAA